MLRGNKNASYSSAIPFSQFCTCIAVTSSCCLEPNVLHIIHILTNYRNKRPISFPSQWIVLGNAVKHEMALFDTFSLDVPCINFFVLASVHVCRISQCQSMCGGSHFIADLKTSQCTPMQSCPSLSPLTSMEPELLHTALCCYRSKREREKRNGILL